MAFKREWTEKEKLSLLEHVLEFKKRGITIKEAAIEFSKQNPHITAGQARVYYYKLLNETDNFRRKYSQRVWTEEENEILFSFIVKSKNKKKIEIFDKLSEKLNRHPKAIASHYYSIKNNKDKLNIKNYINLFNELKENHFQTIFDKIRKIQEIYDKAIEIDRILRREQIIKQLNRELNEARVKIQMLEQKTVVS